MALWPAGLPTDVAPYASLTAMCLTAPADAAAEGHREAEACQALCSKDRQGLRSQGMLGGRQQQQQQQQSQRRQQAAGGMYQQWVPQLARC
jgi:hypothetical protein